MSSGPLTASTTAAAAPTIGATMGQAPTTMGFGGTKPTIAPGATPSTATTQSTGNQGYLSTDENGNAIRILEQAGGYTPAMAPSVAPPVIPPTTPQPVLPAVFDTRGGRAAQDHRLNTVGLLDPTRTMRKF